MRLSRRWLGACAAPAVLVAAWVGCSIDRDYELLSFFFDGVPDPRVGTGQTISGPGGVSLAVVSEHVPYANNACRECHRSTQQLLIDRNDSSMCLACHRPVLVKHEYIHGPVAGVACLWCHRPHTSPHKYLLRKNAAELCTQCHSAETMVNASPVHQDLSRNCLECHSGHGGTDRFFLIRDTDRRAATRQPNEPKDEGAR